MGVSADPDPPFLRCGSGRARSEAASRLRADRTAGDQADRHPGPPSRRHLPHRGEAFTAQPPTGLEPGSPFSPSIEALATYLHHCQGIGFERLSALFRDIFALAVSEGALANLSKR